MGAEYRVKNLGLEWSGSAHWRNWIARKTSNLKVPSSSLGWVKCGGLAQLVERTLSMREVLGSKPKFSKI